MVSGASRSLTMGVVTALLLATASFATVGEQDLASRGEHHHKPANSRPNIIYILSDDHDYFTATEEYMPETYKHLVSHGRKYSHFYTPMSICCPSRVGFLRSQHGHNHNVTDVQAPFGGWDLFYERGYQNDNLATWLRDAGYKTYYTGKLMNGNTVSNARDKPVTKLFDESAVLLDPFTYSYYNSAISWNGQAPQRYPFNYSTDLIKEIGIDYLHQAAQSEEPFFLGIAPIGPHSLIDSPHGKTGFENPIPAKRHLHLYSDVVIPRSPNFNPDVPSGANFVKKYTKLNQTVLDYNDEWHRDRLRSLKSVDDLVGQVIEQVKHLGLLDNTYIIYSSDNGFSTGGQHRRPPGKCLGYEEDIRVPAFIRGPGIEAGSVNHNTWSNIDLAASFAEIARATEKAGYTVDGRIMDWAQHGRPKVEQERVDVIEPQQLVPNSSVVASGHDATHHLSEFWVNDYPEGIYAGQTYTAKYKTLRVREKHSSDKNVDYAYTVWCNGERELYDMVQDPYQMNNLLGNISEYAPLTSKDHRLATRLDALTLSLKDCSGQECRRTWSTLFPNGQVRNVDQAASHKYDKYFDALPRVHFDNCELGFHAEKEAPHWSQELVHH
ncbi:unnamed protein product [Sympodiomycopsis kandeliae]